MSGSRVESRLGLFLLLLAAGMGARALEAPRLVPHPIALADGRSFDLNLPAGFEIRVAAQGLRRVRFLAKSPDGRIFVTDMYDRTDNRKGVVYILDGWDPVAGKFGGVIPYLTGLRNPNNLAFYTAPDGAHWLYLGLTDHLVRYRYHEGDDAPAEPPEVLATFPDYGLSYKYGGWHLTRTVLVGGNGKIYVAVGSSCNACEEKEEVRASLLKMDPDGGNPRFFARGLRNAVGLRWVDGQIYATDMGADHLGDQNPADTFYPLQDGANYGWPYCFQSGSRVLVDRKLNPKSTRMSCRDVPKAQTSFDAHSAPLGLEHFDAATNPEFGGSFLVALHGSTKKSLKRGYRLVRIRKPGASPEDFLTGFLQNGKILGRPADVFRLGPDAFLVTDDYAGVVYYVFKRSEKGE